MLGARWCPEKPGSSSWILIFPGCSGLLPCPDPRFGSIPSHSDRLKSAPLANAKIKPDARLHAAPAKRFKTRAVILSPSGKEVPSGCQKCPSSPLAPR